MKHLQEENVIMHCQTKPEICVDISAAKIRNWGSCCQNMRVYLQPGGHPLLDTLQSRDGTKIKVYLIGHIE
jgi:hypothetical protein